MKAGAFDAGILISLPVCGFLPIFATLSLVSKVPNPINCTFSPFFNSSETISTKAFKVSSVAFLVRSVFLIMHRLILLYSL